MRALAAGCLLLILASAVSAAEQLPRTPACRSALQSLETAESALAATAGAAAASAPEGERQRAIAAKLQPLRVRVANACLGGLTTSPPPSQHTWVGAPSPAATTLARPRAPMPPTAPVTVTLPRPETPVTISNCNGATCQASDGSVLTRVGPGGLSGPRGLCRMEGAFLRCP